MKILALDQSSKVTGYAIFQDGKLIDYNYFSFTNANLGKRLERIRNKIQELVEYNHIDKVVLEDIQLENTVSNNVVAYKALAEVIGVITELLTEMNIQYELVFPNVWRKKLSIMGYQRAECKAKAQQYVKNCYNIESTEDVCDAICIGASQYSPNSIKNDYDWS